MPNYHYIPQWMLDQFREPGKLLYEADIHEPRPELRVYRQGVKKAASDENWSATIEEAIMTPHDTRASEIYRAKVAGKFRVVLTETERWEFARWLAAFFPRVPDTYDHVRQIIEEYGRDPDTVVRLMYREKGRILAKIRHDTPVIYADAIANFGEHGGEIVLLAGVANQIRATLHTHPPDQRALYEHYLRTAQYDRFAEVICGYQWTWYRTRHEFIISDNPLCRWHELSQHFKFGLNRANVVVSIPLSFKTCLYMSRKRNNYHDNIMFCSKALTAEFNRRQRLTAFAHLYGGDKSLLQMMVPAVVKPPKRMPRSCFKTPKSRRTEAETGHFGSCETASRQICDLDEENFWQ